MAMGENVKHDGTEDMASIGATTRREDVEAFRQIAEQRGETVGSMLRRFVQKTIREAAQGARKEETGAVGFVYLTEQNTVRMMREAAKHNPKGLNPDQLTNRIIDGYFTLADQIRR